MAAIIEMHHNEAGIAWPPAVAPYDMHLVSLLKSGDQAERLYADLQAAGVSVLYDDRAESAGVKFADLIGCPVMLVNSLSLCYNPVREGTDIGVGETWATPTFLRIYGKLPRTRDGESSEQ